MTSKSSEFVLLALLLVMVGFVRVYYGGGPGEELIFVWKGEFTYRDTLVNLGAILKMPRAQLSSVHPSVLYQLEEMGICSSEDNSSEPPRQIPGSGSRYEPDGVHPSGNRKPEAPPDSSRPEKKRPSPQSHSPLNPDHHSSERKGAASTS